MSSSANVLARPWWGAWIINNTTFLSLFSLSLLFSGRPGLFFPFLFFRLHCGSESLQLSVLQYHRRAARLVTAHSKILTTGPSRRPGVGAPASDKCCGIRFLGPFRLAASFERSRSRRRGIIVRPSAFWTCKYFFSIFVLCSCDSRVTQFHIW
jgi:hypothetical protein